MQIEIPFLERFRKPMLGGQKCMTSRNKRHGKVGDTFNKFGATFRLVWIFKLPLSAVANLFHESEGFATSNDFIECWKELHPRKGYVQDQIVWVHKFEKLEESEK